MLAQYKTKQRFTERILPSFLKRAQVPKLYELRCNINDKQQIDSPLSLQWDPIFTYLDENKESFRFVFSAIFYPKVKRIDVLNLRQLVQYQQDITNKKFISVDRETMRDLVKCLIRSNKQALDLYGPKLHVEFEYRQLRASNTDYADISMKILNFKPIKEKKLSLASLITNNQEQEVKALQKVDVIDGCVVGQKRHSYYFFLMNDKGEKIIKNYYKNIKGNLCINTPISSEEYASPYRKSFEQLLEVVCNSKVIEKVITADLLKSSSLMEVIVLPDNWKIQKLKTLKVDDIELSLGNAYQENYFWSALSKAITDVQFDRVKPEVLRQHFEEIHI